MSIDFKNPDAVLQGIADKAPTVLGVSVNYEYLSEAIIELLKKKHKAFYVERIQHLSAERLSEMLELIQLETPDFENNGEAEEVISDPLSDLVKEMHEASATAPEALSTVSEQSKDTAKGSGHNSKSALR